MAPALRSSKRNTKDELKQKIVATNSKKRRSIIEDAEYSDDGSEEAEGSTPGLSVVTNKDQIAEASDDSQTDLLESKFPKEAVDIGNGEGVVDLIKLGKTAKSKDEIYLDEEKHILYLKNSRSTHKKVRYNRDGTLRSKFSDIKFKPQQSIFDEKIKFGAPFYGFYVAAWFSTGISVLRVLIIHYMKHGDWTQASLVQMMSTGLIYIGLTDLAMYLYLYVSVFIQLGLKKNLYSWNTTGYYLQAGCEVLFFCGFLTWNMNSNFHWIGRIFLLLHSLVLLMKLHSYGFYNGYLWEIKRELSDSKSFLKRNSDEDEDEDLDEQTKVSIEKSISFCEFELKANKEFPNNISFWNFFEFTMFPTLVYEMSYPRTDKIRYDYLAGKVIGIFGVISLMIILSESFLYPIVLECLHLRETESFLTRLKLYPLILLDTIPPFLAIYLLVFYLIWELICNAIAEISMFADRDFYKYWWNDVTWDEYARDWNTPVHTFLLRHVYHSSISAFHFSKAQATLTTFFLSSIFHELAMAVIFRKVRCYLLFFQMSQLPLVAISRTRFLKDRKIVGNVIFWFGIICGPSLMCTCYLLF